MLAWGFHSEASQQQQCVCGRAQVSVQAFLPGNTPTAHLSFPHQHYHLPQVSLTNWCRLGRQRTEAAAPLPADCSSCTNMLLPVSEIAFPSQLTSAPASLHGFMQRFAGFRLISFPP